MPNPEIFTKQMIPPRAISLTSFAADVLKLIGGTIIAQALLILATPIVTRLYDPESFGISALFTSITGVIGVIVCLRYELAIMLPKNDEEAANILALSLLSTIFISILAIPVIWLSWQPLLHLLKTPGLAPYLWLVPPSIFMSGVYLALNYWNSRTRRFGRLSIARVAGQIAGTGTQLGSGFAGNTTGGSLISAGLVGSAISTLMLGSQIWRDDWQVLKESINIHGILLGLMRYKRFPIFDTWSALLNSISWQLPAFLLSAFFSTSIVGYYALGMMVLQLPMSLIGGAISQVFFQRASIARYEGNLAIVVENLVRILVVIGMFPILILFFYGKDLFSMGFGSAWAEAGVYIQILSVWGFFWFISSPLSSLFSVFEKQGSGLKLSLGIFLTRLVALYIGGLLGNARLAIALFSLSGIFVYSYLCYVLIVYSGVPCKNVTMFVIRKFALFIPAGIVSYGLKLTEIPLLVQICIWIIILLGYYIRILKTDPQMRVLFRQLRNH